MPDAGPADRGAVKVAVLRRRWSRAGGGERFAQALVEALAQAGHEVHLFAERWREPPAGVQVHRVVTLPGGSALRTLVYAVLAPRAARRAGAEIVHSLERTTDQDIYRAGEGCHRQWLELRRRHLGSRAWRERWRPFHRVVLALEERICRRGAARLLVVNSRLVETGFRRFYRPLGVPMAIIRNGVDLARFSPDLRQSARAAARQGLGLEPGDLTLLLIGSGFARKGLGTAVRALAAVSRLPAVPRLLVAGRGESPRFLAVARQLGVERQVRFLGPRDDTQALYAAADLVVLPSVYDPASTATLEAMAMGVPVVTTTTNGSSEVIEHGVSGWLLRDPDDAQGLARVVEEAADASRRERIGRAARDAVEAWPWERTVRETLELYASVRPAPVP